MPFSTVSGVPIRSCDPSLGAMFVARVLTTRYPNLMMKESCFEFWWMDLWYEGVELLATFSGRMIGLS